MVDLIIQLSRYLNEHQINHRFVGGVSWSGLLNKQTTYNIDIKKRSIRLHKYNQLVLTRTDGSPKDIDIIVFIEKESDYQKLKLFALNLRKNYPQPPIISIENARYEKAEQGNIWQFVTALSVKNGTLFLTFDSIREEISWESIAPWQVILDGGVTYTVRNPIADSYAYRIRVPSGTKPKDVAKLTELDKLRDEVIKQGKEIKIDFMSEEYFAPWKRYQMQLAGSSEISVQIKRTITKIYWSTIGTALAHGGGLLGIIAEKLSNQFTGSRQ
ncbi:hypothetical protein HGB07_06665 [Candidatus Roizmanbacteria bacterium]|nr:hypothetical protein [Candidatus Roizmanbacteria bacterium]